MSKKYNEKRLVNLSSATLTESETNLLQKGLNFCPRATKMDKMTTYTDIDRLKRTLLLKIHFQDQSEKEYKSTTLESIARKEQKSKFEPPSVAAVEAYAEALKDGIKTAKKNNVKDNLTLRERKALSRLTERDDIVIKQADKGGVTVIMDTTWYKAEALRQLSDETYYKQLTEDSTRRNEEVIGNTLDHLAESGEISKKEAAMMTPIDSRTPEFYALPKIHKPTIPGRPVISSCGSPTEKISAYVDQHIKPVAQSLKSYIQDTGHFLDIIRKIGRVGKDHILVSLDVTSLYTNIDNTEGISATRKHLTSTGSTKVNAICTLLNLVLMLNNFIFNNKHYLQIKGTAMGTRAAPNYANLFMGEFEEKYVYGSKWKRYLTYYGRFIDDIFIIWNGSEEELKHFISHMNAVHNSIKFTSKQSNSEIEFLDVLVRKDSKGYLSTDIYQKPTDTHSYLNYKSAHPPHCKKSIPFSQFIRLQRICSDKEHLRTRLNEFIRHFSHCGYRKGELRKTAELVFDNSYTKKDKKPANKYRLITTYNELLPDIRSLCTEHWKMTRTNEKCREFLKDSPQVAYKRNKNIKDHLVKAKFREHREKDTNTTHGRSSKCDKRRCSWCKNVQDTTRFISRKTNKTYKMRHNLNCRSDWTIYLAECSVHKKQYVGKTKPQLNIRMNNNRNHIKVQLRSCKLTEHFIDSTTCSLDHDLQITPIERIKSRDGDKTVEEREKILLRREIFWQNELQTFHPYGMNKREG